MGRHAPGWVGRLERLDDIGRLQDHVSETELVRLLALKGDENLLDLGSGTGFYTDRVAPLTTGTLYAVEILPEMHAHHRKRGLPANVKLLPGDITALSVKDSDELALGPTDQPESLRASSVEVAYTIATWHEIDGKLDVPGVARVLSPNGRLLVIDWRTDPASWKKGPPLDERISAQEVVDTLSSHFVTEAVQPVGDHMYAVSARRR